jgi:hypothetical protein
MAGEPRITRGAGLELARAAFREGADQHLTPAHRERLGGRGWGVYEIAPQADEWEPVLGYTPDRRAHLEYGFMVVEEPSGRTTPVCRVLVDRREPGSVVRVEWYPTAIDPRKRPD